jgi:hypothetical protein
MSRTYRHSSSSKKDTGAHLAILAVSAVIIFQIIGIASNFHLTGSSSGITAYAVAKTQHTEEFKVVQSYNKYTNSCENYLDSNNPKNKGYVEYTDREATTTAYDSCIDGNYLLEYYCDASNVLHSDIVKCSSGCFSQDAYGYCG